MKLVFVIEDKEHNESAGLDIKEEARKNQVSTDTIINQIQDDFWEFAQNWKLSCHLDYAAGDFEDKDNCIFNRLKK